MEDSLDINCPSMYGSSKWASTNFMANQRGVTFDIVIEDQVIGIKDGFNLTVV